MPAISDTTFRELLHRRKKEMARVAAGLAFDVTSQEDSVGVIRHALAPDTRIMASQRVFRSNLPLLDPFLSFVVDPEPEDDQISGASLDLRVGDEVFTMKGEFTSLAPKDIPRFARSKRTLKQGEKLVLWPGRIYVVKSLERMRIPMNYYGISDARSSLARVGCGGGAATTKNGILDGGFYNQEPEFIYFKMEPHAFPILLKGGETRPIQIRFRENESGPLNAKEIKEIYGKELLLYEGETPLKFNHDLLEENGLVLRLNTSKYYVQRKNVKTPIDISQKRVYNSEEFFELVEDGDEVILHPGRLYLFGTRERIVLDKMVCGDLVRSTDTLGQGLSNNFARFFDPGFDGEVTLEVWVYKGHSWQLFNGQYFGRVLIERLDSEPTRPGSSYQGQKAPQLPKMFKQE